MIPDLASYPVHDIVKEATCVAVNELTRDVGAVVSQVFEMAAAYPMFPEVSVALMFKVSVVPSLQDIPIFVQVPPLNVALLQLPFEYWQLEIVLASVKVPLKLKELLTNPPDSLLYAMSVPATGGAISAPVHGWIFGLVIVLTSSPHRAEASHFGVVILLES